jgi:small-conductance mechanosensitive channel
MEDLSLFVSHLLEVEVLQNPLSAWLTALGIAVSINLLVALFKMVATRRLAGLASRTTTSLDDALVTVLDRTKQGLVLVVTLYIGSRYLDLPDRADVFLKGAATIAAFLQIGLWISAAFRFWMDRYKARAVQADVGAATSFGALAFIGQLVLWSIVLLVGLDNLGVNVTALVAGLGVGGIAVALAVQNILGDLFASLSIVIDKPFVVGDFIIVDDYLGSVEYVGLKTTRLRSLGGEQLVFSNSDLLKARVRNYKRMYERRIVFTFGLSRQMKSAQVERAVQLVKDLLNAEALVRLDRAHFFKFGESSLDFEVVYWMKDPDYNKYMDVQQRVNLKMMQAFEKEGIEFAFPTRTMVMGNAVQVQPAAADERKQGDGGAVRPAVQ